jgi:hypothetical protein
MDYKLELSGTEVNLTGYTDSSYNSLSDNGRSVSGSCFSVGNGYISWYSKNQRSVALSSCEAEYMALSTNVKECIWLRNLLIDLGYKNQEPTNIYCDNQSTIAVAKNPVFHNRTKHIAIRYHFVREKVKEGIVRIEYMKGKEIVADGFTKVLGKESFRTFVKQLGIVGGSVRVYH